MSLSTTIISEISAEPMDSSDLGNGAAQLTEDDQVHLMEFLEQTLYAELKAEGITRHGAVIRSSVSMFCVCTQRTRFYDVTSKINYWSREALSKQQRHTQLQARRACPALFATFGRSSWSMAGGYFDAPAGFDSMRRSVRSEICT